MKLIDTSSGAMPTHLERWPEAYERVGIQTPGALLMRGLIRIVPLRLLQGMSPTAAFLIDILPKTTSDTRLLRAGRVFSAGAYLVGMKLRNRP